MHGIFLQGIKHNSQRDLKLTRRRARHRLRRLLSRHHSSCDRSSARFRESTRRTAGQITHVFVAESVDVSVATASFARATLETFPLPLTAVVFENMDVMLFWLYEVAARLVAARVDAPSISSLSLGVSSEFGFVISFLVCFGIVQRVRGMRSR